MGAPFRLYNTRTRDVEGFVPSTPGVVGLYVCGMTVYDDAHIGHARAMVVFDTFVRYLRYRSWQVTFVRNFTDVDDKIIRRAIEAGRDPLELAEHYIENFRRDMTNLGLAPPDAEPRVTQSMDEIIALIAKLVERDHAYEAEGSVWFDVTSDDDYGALSGQQLDQLRSEDPGTGKRHPADFALWKAKKEGEPSWESPWGPGRPGWHVECSAMAWHALGETIDIHGGGLDLVFPHHENEVAQSECAHGQRYANYWMHNGLLCMQSGRKMGKSEGNAVAIHDLLESFPAEALRLYYLQNHYRSPLPFDETALPEALCMLGRLYEAREVAEGMRGEEEPTVVAEALGADAIRVLELSEGFESALHAALDDDFNTAAALGHAFELARAVNRMSNHKKAMRRAGPIAARALEAFALVERTLGLMADTTESFQAEIKAKRLPHLGLTPEEVEELLTKRAEARVNKDWATADAIRDKLETHSIAVMDREHGSDWRVRLNASGAGCD
ncbi:MAG: cysteine--tRNA ligase [Myxococcales bacterium]|nr:cysteine--tRNA ligase [Myxococcales bacterium]